MRISPSVGSINSTALLVKVLRGGIRGEKVLKVSFSNLASIVDVQHVSRLGSHSWLKVPNKAR